MARTKIVLFTMLFMLMSVQGYARKLTTTAIRENTIRINALEIEPIDITKVREKVEIPKEVTIVLDSRILNFDFDSSKVKEEYTPILKEVIEYMNYYGYDTYIEGHTDSYGTDEYNMALGERRALSVKRELIKLGLDENKILGISSKGESEPVAENTTKEGRFQNRRIEFKMVLRDK